MQVVNSYPEARAYLGLAKVRSAIAMYKSAKQMIDKAHEIDPDDPDIQSEWIDTLSRSERIKYLETSLVGENNWDADQRSDVANYLQYLRSAPNRRTPTPVAWSAKSPIPRCPWFPCYEIRSTCRATDWMFTSTATRVR